MLSIEGIVVNIEGQKRGRIEIDQTTGLITKVGEPTGSADIVLKEELIFPGFIDLHVHAREDASHVLDYKEDFTTAGQAAINGGIVAFVDMVNNKVPTVTEETYLERKNLAKKSIAEAVLSVPIGKGTRPFNFHVPYKIFLSQSVGGLFFDNIVDLEENLKFYEGQCVSFHCENPSILEENKNQPSHEDRRPPEAEISAIESILDLIEKYKIKAKICHCSTTEGLEKITAAKKRGVNVAVEVTPHHLYFDESMLNENNRLWLQVNPPIRQTKENRLALIEALRNGQIDYLATDHAPHTIEEKQKGASGLPHLDTYGPFTTWLMKEYNFTAEEIARVCARNPAEFFNKFTDTKYGKIEAGYAGSLTVIDADKPILINKEMLKTKCGWSPFEGVTFPGIVVMTIVKGKLYDKK
jgi:dihydroorotase